MGQIVVRLLLGDSQVTFQCVFSVIRDQKKYFVFIERIQSKKLHAQPVLNNYIRYIMLKLLIIAT